LEDVEVGDGCCGGGLEDGVLLLASSQFVSRETVRFGTSVGANVVILSIFAEKR
jgi:hypothetical protein